MKAVPAQPEELTRAEGVEQSDRVVKGARISVRVVKGGTGNPFDPKRRTRAQQLSDLRNELRRLDGCLGDHLHAEAAGLPPPTNNTLAAVPKVVTLMFALFPPAAGQTEAPDAR